MITRQKEPQNLETPFSQVDSYITPNHLFYIRSHFPIPKIDLASYRLEIVGAVDRPFSISYEELEAMSSESQTAVLECAGNGRVFLNPQVEGAQWELGAVGNAEWTGVPLGMLLEKAGLQADACEIVLEGADRGQGKIEPAPHGPISYCRSISCELALRRDVLVALRMNGELLSPAHGFPVRAIVPGHYGMASVKWLNLIRAVKEPFQGYWQTTDYASWESVDGQTVRRPLGPMQLKSQIGQPTNNAVLEPAKPITINGAAWKANGEVKEILVSTNGGATWNAGEFIDPPRSNTWRRWKFDWITPEAEGMCILLCRALDANGAAQPDGHDEKHGTYVINHPLPIEVHIKRR
jgi:DMSO/TMAO reductase YedYZ molybdopterin-dependent catalytic subunit